MKTQNANSEMNVKSGKGAAFSGMFAALAASSCCIPPVIAAIAGVGGIAGSLSWMEPLRPYLIGIAVIAIGYAWYNHFQRQKSDDCCAIDLKPKWYQTKGFLVGITLFAAVSIAFPYYSKIFFPSNSKKEVVIVSSDNIQEVKYNVSGMTCASCEEHVKHAVNELPGIVSVSANSEEGIANIKFDNSKTDKVAITKAIDGTGYKVSGEITKDNPAHGEVGHVCGPNGCK